MYLPLIIACARPWTGAVISGSMAMNTSPQVSTSVMQ